MLWRKLQNCIKCIHSSFACCMIREGIRGRREREREGRGMSTKSVLKCVSSASGKVSEIFERGQFGWGEMDRYLHLDFSKTDFNLSKIVNLYLFFKKSIFFCHFFYFVADDLTPQPPFTEQAKGVNCGVVSWSIAGVVLRGWETPRRCKRGRGGEFLSVSQSVKCDRMMMKRNKNKRRECKNTRQVKQ